VRALLGIRLGFALGLRCTKKTFEFKLLLLLLLLLLNGGRRRRRRKGGKY